MLHRCRTIKIFCKKSFAKTSLVSIICALLTAGLYAQNIPSNDNSKKAIAKVEPALEKALAEYDLAWGVPIYIRIFKEEMELEIWVCREDSFILFKTYPIYTYGSMGLGPKLRQGDGKAPEGFYFVRPGNLNPASKFHLSFNIGYPNTYDKVHNRTGSAIMVHGSTVSIGCYAMTDRYIEEIYALADAAFRNGQSFFRIHIFPFRMTESNMNEHNNSIWCDFWENLKEGYDFFEENDHVPPNVEVRNNRYVFE